MFIAHWVLALRKKLSENGRSEVLVESDEFMSLMER